MSGSKSQHKNKEGIWRFAFRLYEQELAKKQAEDATKRTSQVSSGDRSARFVLITMHKVNGHTRGLTLYDLGNIMNGDSENC
jgi:peptide chain release factor 1